MQARVLNQAELVSIICLETGVQPAALQREMLLEDLGVTSFDMVSVLFQIEDAYGVEMDENDLPQVDTFGDLVDYLIATIKARQVTAPPG